ncbi:MAG: cellulase family glycosylhydrolase [Clostridia bacterium]|nr:cellulase family glycosylhydrolase [Clostridia bacterium]
MDFLTGVNYWASNAGMHTFKDFNESVIDKDFEFLKSYGVNTVRVFPLWPDFQPVENSRSKTDTFPLRNNGVPLEYSTYKSGLDESACKKFETLLTLAKKHGLKVIVALITGWMSGKKFVPEAVGELNPITDKKAIVLECAFIEDFVNVFKESEQIIAWELGNECNALSLESPRYDNDLWVQTVSQAIRLADPTRPVYAGMHGLSANGNWSLQTLGKFTDMQTTHPYPLFTPFCSKEEMTCMRASLHASAESEYYASISKKPCLVEEIGTLGPMVISGEKAGEYLEKAYATAFASGTTGFLWWCAFDQDKLDFAPYDVFAIEQNLGIAYDNKTPKHTLIKLNESSNFFKKLPKLPAPEKDICFILSSEQDEWKTAYGAYVLAIQSGHGATFTFENQPLPDSKYYVLPSITSQTGIPSILVKQLTEKVENGAKLLITYNGGYLSNFEGLSGLEVQGRTEMPETLSFSVDNAMVEVKVNGKLMLKPVTAKEIITTETDVILTKNSYGKGSVYFFNAPLENSFSEEFYPENTNLYKVYETVFENKLPISVNNQKVATYVYKTQTGYSAILVNFSNEKTVEVNANGTIKNARGCTVNGNALTFEKTYAYIEVE